MKKYVSWQFAFCFAIAWMITKGWAYVALAIGTLLRLRYVIWISSGYLTFLWLPFTPEKIITVAISCRLMGRLFKENPNS